MSKDAKAAKQQRLAEALRANLRRRKVAQGMREAETPGDRNDTTGQGSRETPRDDKK